MTPKVKKTKPISLEQNVIISPIRDPNKLKKENYALR